MRVVTTLEIGSTITKANAFSLEDGRFRHIGQGFAPTSVAQGDVKIGVDAAIDEMRKTQQGLGLSELAVSFDARAARVTLTGQAPSQEAAEKAGLAAGNVSHVNDVDNQLQFPAGTASQFHEIGRAHV